MNNAIEVKESSSSKAAKIQNRMAPPVRIAKIERATRPDLKDIIDNHKPDKEVIDRIKKNNPDTPFYLVCTPDICLTLLTLNDPGKNRFIKWKKIETYTGVMKAGEWADRNGESVKISKTFKLIDGQHRLWSAYITGKTIELLIATGLKDEVYSKIDLHAPRSAEDVTSINGFQKNAAALAYAIKCIVLFDKKSLFKGSVQETEVHNFEVDKWQKEVARMEWMNKTLELIKTSWIKDTKAFFTPPQWLAIFHILRSLPGCEKDAKYFLDSFASGANLARTHPIKVLRGEFEKEFEGATKFKRRNKIAGGIMTMKVKYVFTAWDLWRAGWTGNKIEVDLQSSKEIKKPSSNRRK